MGRREFLVLGKEYSARPAKLYLVGISDETGAMAYVPGVFLEGTAPPVVSQTFPISSPPVVDDVGEGLFIESFAFWKREVSHASETSGPLRDDILTFVIRDESQGRKRGFGRSRDKGWPWPERG